MKGRKVLLFFFTLLGPVWHTSRRKEGKQGRRRRENMVDIFHIWI
jgi:hypothetical protein